ncbi:hypothetical protein [Aureispira anguillae]|uniref:Uncharacterized protein n=1 Tax=Aureispira anguillae TaxID=2864201 RepID=A0A915YJ63_9BACT|nr:hypothetical protein [Aureispira anguillae]BDS13936.1 hypothetical protein AsAng_0046990 [Aureispira anguillae]
MIYKTILISLFFYLPFFGYSQQLLLVHRPFSQKEVTTWRYGKDTVPFNSDDQIWGLVYLPNIEQKKAKITLAIENDLGEKTIASFWLKKVLPNQLNWHSSIRKWQKHLLNSPHWYAFEITPQPAFVDAYNGVAFLEIIHQTAKENRSTRFTYNVEGKYTEHSCTINFTQQGAFAPLWTKLTHYQQLIREKETLEQQQIGLVQQCQPHGFAQVQEWAHQASGLKTDLATSDLNIFKAVENLKIVTEAIPNSISPYLKRELRALFLLDLTILELPEGSDKTQKNRQKADLIKQLSLYPELQNILTQYTNSTGTANLYKKTEAEQKKVLQDIIKKYRPYQSIYNAHQKLQLELIELKALLVDFD